MPKPPSSIPEGGGFPVISRPRYPGISILAPALPFPGLLRCGPPTARLGDSGHASSATGSAKPEFPRRGRHGREVQSPPRLEGGGRAMRGRGDPGANEGNGSPSHPRSARATAPFRQGGHRRATKGRPYGGMSVSAVGADALGGPLVRPALPCHPERSEGSRPRRKVESDEILRRCASQNDSFSPRRPCLPFPER